MSKNKNKTDFFRRRVVKLNEKSRLSFKAIFFNCSLPPSIREKAFEKINQLPRNSAKTRVRNRCILTGRGRGVYKNFRLSRIMIRQLIAQNLLQGISKMN
jgi:ribosomal protein S14